MKNDQDIPSSHDGDTRGPPAVDLWFWPFGWWQEAAHAWAQASARFFGYALPLDAARRKSYVHDGALPLGPGLVPVDPWVVLRTWMPHIEAVLDSSMPKNSGHGHMEMRFLFPEEGAAEKDRSGEGKHALMPEAGIKEAAHDPERTKSEPEMPKPPAPKKEKRKSVATPRAVKTAPSPTKQAAEGGVTKAGRPTRRKNPELSAEIKTAAQQASESGQEPALKHVESPIPPIAQPAVLPDNPRPHTQ
jgi:hypothetical protein